MDAFRAMAHKLAAYERAFDAACTAWHFFPSDDPKADLDRLAAMERGVTIDLIPLADVIEARLKKQWDETGAGAMGAIAWTEPIIANAPAGDYKWLGCVKCRAKNIYRYFPAETEDDAKRLAIRTLAEIIAKEVEGA